MTAAPMPHWIAADPAIKQALAARSGLWLVTGGAGFIGSHLLEDLLLCGQRVRALDNFSTGYRHNLDEVRARVGEDRWRNCTVIEADIRDRGATNAAVEGVDYVLHQAALGSVPRSLADPLTTHDVNCTGFLNLLEAARQAGVENFVYAASSSTYGDEPTLPKVENKIGNPLSPYAVTKYVNEVYANVYATAYGMAPIGLRYFNVFGPRQDPAGAYAAVIPLWVAAMLKGEAVTIYGDGETSRDFCYVANVVQANLRAALAGATSKNQVYNVAVGERTSLNSLFRLLRSGLGSIGRPYTLDPTYCDFRAGDVRHSLADIDKARRLLGYDPTHATAAGLAEALPWYVQHC